jgi:cytochrome b561
VSNRVQRFTVSERAIHWLMALAFFSLLLSGLVVGRRGTFHDVMYAWHLASAGLLVCGVALIVMAGDRRAYAAGRRRSQSRERRTSVRWPRVARA